MEFDGGVLERGFGFFVWRIGNGTKTLLYVGRTGDSSSCHASSPFKRIGQHLEVGRNAKGNALGRQLEREGVSPQECRFKMVAIGPVFAEQACMEQHRIYGDQTAALERALSDRLKARGYRVIGSHPRPGSYELEIFDR